MFVVYVLLFGRASLNNVARTIALFKSSSVRITEPSVTPPNAGTDEHPRPTDCIHHLPNTQQVLCFDTLFHSTIPPHVYTYPIVKPTEEPPMPLRKYGAHGLSYAFILRTMSKHLGKPNPNLIMCHLGSGASVCMVKDGKSYDTSMGLTPLQGTCMSHAATPRD